MLCLRHSRLRAGFEMDLQEKLRAKLHKVEALFAGAGTEGERNAAAAAVERIKLRLAEAGRTGLPVEMKFTLGDRWSRQMFLALCRRYGLKPYRNRGQRQTTVMLRVPVSFVDQTLWPEFCQINEALVEYLSEVTSRIIREEVHRDTGDAAER